MAELYRLAGFLGVAAFIGPLMLAREAFLQRSRADSAVRDLAIRREALRNVDERIADERRDERARIAEALHDDVLQCLYSVSVRAYVIRECYRTGRLLDLETDVPDLVATAERAVDELRDVIRGLRRSHVGHAGLVETLSLLVEHIRDTSGKVVVADIEPTLTASPTSELLAYQIAREALTNSVKHSRAETIWVSLRRDGPSLYLNVVDNGEGFDRSAPRDQRHFGLDLMNERASSIGGTLDVSSKRGAGTAIIAVLPTESGR
jgi:signal transduction histidine kinase